MVGLVSHEHGVSDQRNLVLDLVSPGLHEYSIILAFSCAFSGVDSKLLQDDFKLELVNIVVILTIKDA